MSEALERIAAIDAVDLAWLAGLIEGEGSFGTARRSKSSLVRYRYAQIQVRMTDEDVVRRVHAIAGGGLHGPYAPRQEGYAPIWAWKIQHTPAAALMRRLRPLMGVRRAAAIDAVLAIEETERARGRQARAESIAQHRLMTRNAAGQFVGREIRYATRHEQ